MRIAIISVTSDGTAFSSALAEKLDGFHTDRYAFEKYADENSSPFSSVYDLAAEIFGEYDALVFICAAGIAVRAVGAIAASKVSDPAVICMDERGRFVIPLLSGHLGGANALAEIIAKKVGALPVITTATDIGGKFSPDSFAKANGLVISDMTLAKKIAAGVLNGEKIGFFSECPVKNIPHIFSENAEIGIVVGEGKKFSETLELIPKNIILGIGCKRDTSCENLESFVFKLLEKNSVNSCRICAVATIDLKKDEPALISLCKRLGVTLRTFTAEELSAVEGEFSHSDFVLKTTGTDNVCERSAAACGGEIFLRKQAENGMTLALAQLPVEIDFNKRILQI